LRHGFAAGGYFLGCLFRCFFTGCACFLRRRSGNGVTTMLAVAIPAATPPPALAALAIAALAVLGALLVLALLLRMARLFGLHRNLFLF
ncbi:hypothetical protein, partial [Mesorhizobium sp. M2D.F.Ca.ET.223.01.1.1]|uniref:hypothetical protein n=1 Tax=Mesorhizobium sp. M2D.F.Ca.ET.223.01.1.1 TaxID=2563940 RepID=UPI001676C1B6